MPTYPGPATPELVSFFNTQSDTPGPFVLDIFNGAHTSCGIIFEVGFLFLATIAQTGFATYCAWQILVVSWSKTETASVLPIINGIISATANWFLNRTTVGWIFAVLIGIIAILQLLAMIVFTLACLLLIVLGIIP
ncbi:hypothetical protein BD779DRAFT_1583661 [Infundibulicybe gibba]|nr:hypothetical protein BD779DRAFT_1583661 [Infundibulicybe gibba]